MKQIMTTAFLFCLTISLLAQKNDFAKMPKSVKQFTDQMVMVEAKTFIMGNAAPANISPADSLLVSGNLKRVVSTAAFYMSKNEVSNLEYRTFCEDMEKQQGKELASQFLPDTLVWLKEFPNGFFQPFTEHYFRHPAYNDYPVVGVSLEQAQAYCKWATLELNKNSRN
jgi:formylglycine-generating enzyme